MAIIIRGAGDKPGADITSEVLTNLQAQRERGRQEINANDSDRVMETLTLINTAFVTPGSTAQIQSRGLKRNGRVTSFSLQLTPSSVSTSIIVEVVK